MAAEAQDDATGITLLHPANTKKTSDEEINLQKILEMFNASRNLTPTQDRQLQI
jgi:hypothetical protein